MPVVELSYDRLLHLVSAGRGVTKDVLSERLPFLGLDIESDDGDAVRVEYSPNRPDYATDIGVALGLQGILGIRKGPVPFSVRGQGGESKGGAPSMRVSRTVSAIRPVLTGIIARGRRGHRSRRGGSARGVIDDALLRQLVALQEDLHFGLGRNRKKVAIGLHDLSKISGFPLEYRAVDPRRHRFTPLGGTEMTALQILRDTRAGMAYGHLLSGFEKYPVILDPEGNTVSMPPIINSEMTAVTTGTSDVLVEVTGTSRHAAENVLAIVAVTLHAAGFDLESVAIEGGGGNRTPPLEPRIIEMSLKRANEVLGLGLTARDASLCLERCRLKPLGRTGGGNNADDAVISCAVPPYRPDITSEIDLIEEVALGYGTWRISPVLLPPGAFGGVRTAQSRILSGIDAAMVGMGYLEALNPGLTSSCMLYEMAGRATPRPGRLIATVGSKSSEHAVLRDSLLPGLVENLSGNIHEAYPQRLFETGTVFSRIGPQSKRMMGGGGGGADTPSLATTMQRQQRGRGRLQQHATASDDTLVGGHAAGRTQATTRGTISEDLHVAAVSAHADSSFSEAKSVLLSMLDAAASATGSACRVRTVAASHHMFAEGRCAKILAAAEAGAGRRILGYVGEINPEILSAYRIRVAAAGFELSVPEPAPQI